MHLSRIERAWRRGVLSRPRTFSRLHIPLLSHHSLTWCVVMVEQSIETMRLPHRFQPRSLASSSILESSEKREGREGKRGARPSTNLTNRSKRGRHTMQVGENGFGYFDHERMLLYSVWCTREECKGSHEMESALGSKGALGCWGYHPRPSFNISSWGMGVSKIFRSTEKERKGDVER